jgi:hypothetical protein
MCVLLIVVGLMVWCAVGAWSYFATARCVTGRLCCTISELYKYYPFEIMFIRCAHVVVGPFGWFVYLELRKW